MLKLKNISLDISKIHNESDYYINIRILFEKISFSNNVCYWNAYGKEESLVQIGLLNPIGAIYKIICFLHPTITHKIISDSTIIYANVPEKIGLPLFETYLEKYQMGYYHIDENINFEVYISTKNTTILFSSNTVTLHVINDPIIFGFDQNNNLCYIHIKNMILNEEDFLEEYTFKK